MSTQKAKSKSKSKKPTKASEVRVSQHPRARRSIGLAKSYAGLAAFLFVGWASWRAGAEFVDVAARALLWGVAAYLLVWALAVQVWRHVVIAEVRAAEQRWRTGRQTDDEQVAKLTRILDDNGMPTSGTGS